MLNIQMIGLRAPNDRPSGQGVARPRARSPWLKAVCAVLVFSITTAPMAQPMAQVPNPFGTAGAANSAINPATGFGANVVPGAGGFPGGFATPPVGQPPSASPVGGMGAGAGTNVTVREISAVERALSLGRVSEQDSLQLLNDLAESLVRVYKFTLLPKSAGGAQSAAIESTEGASHESVRLMRESVAGKEEVVLTLTRHPRRISSLGVVAKRAPAQGGDATPLAMLTDGSLVRQITRVLTERRRILAALPLSDLASRTIELSYVDADAAIFALRAMGFAAITDSDGLATENSYKGEDESILVGAATEAMPVGGSAAVGGPGGFGASSGSAFGGGFGSSSGSFGSVAGGFGSSSGSFGSSSGGFGSGQNFGSGSSGGNRLQALRNLPGSINLERLPLIVKLPAADPRSTGLVGADAGGGGGGQGSGGGGGSSGLQRDSLGLTVVPSAANVLPETVTGISSQLLVLYHPAYPAQLERARKALAQVIDKPARQVYIEGLVIEISEDGLRELGVQWGASKDNLTLGLGAAQQPGPGDYVFSFARDTTKLISPTEIRNRINAIVTKNKAEILSRPSVITLDNRQATIRVGTDIPISTSRDTGGGAGGRVAFSFQYIPTGILLNVRPRIAEDNSEISLQVDATVSATVPNQDLQVIDPTSKIVLASAPSISTRRVQTYARIRNSYPLIIGGLVSKSATGRDDKVPGLGEVPGLGKLFGRDATRSDKREVVIVLIPSIVTENIRETKAQYPKDDERFDLRGTDLMREHYRLRAEDLQDSQYIRTNRRFLAYREAANLVMKAKPELAAKAPFSQFEGDRVPGEFTFVTGMMYKTLGRLAASEPLNADKMFYFERGADGFQQPVSILDTLARLGNGNDAASFFTKNPGKALALTFRLARQSTNAADMFAEPMPDVRLVDCANRAEWARLLWQMNQPAAGVGRFTILLHEAGDLERLKLAFATKNTVLNNGLERSMVFNNWLPGKLLHLQDASPNWDRLIEATVARYFFIGQHAYSSFIAQHEKAISDVAQALREPDIAPLVRHLNLP